MSEHHDPLKQAFGLLRSRSRGREAPRPDLEERLMQALNERQTSSRRRRRIGAVLIACLAAGGTALASSGVVAKLNEWFGRVELVSPDGGSQTYTLHGHTVSDEAGSEVGELTITPSE